MSGWIRRVPALLVVAVPLACVSRHQAATNMLQERVLKAKDQAQAEKALAEWDRHLTRAQELASSGKYRDALVEIETAMQLVQRYGIREEGATYNDAFTVLDRVPAAEKGGLLLQLLANAELVETKDAIIAQAVAYLELDAKTREQIGALPQASQVEVVSDRLVHGAHVK